MKTLLAATALSTALLAAPAMAADLSRGVAPSPALAPASVVDYGFNWTGGYVGANVGYRWLNADASNGALPASSSPDSSSAAGGLQAGYNWQMNQFVFGVETDFGYGSSSKTENGLGVKQTWEGTTRARAGVAVDRFLVYGTAGVAYSDFDFSTAGVGSSSDWRLGWTAGGGVEYALTKNVSVKGEYLYTDYGNEKVDGTKFDLSNSLVRLGVNYKF